jgi:hypothetical protein
MSTIAPKLMHLGSTRPPAGLCLLAETEAMVAGGRSSFALAEEVRPWEVGDVDTWAKLHAKVAESEDLMLLHSRNPNAALLFLLAIPQAAPWGILPALPALFRARVCPLFDLSLEQIAECIALIIAQGCFTSYTDRDGKPLIYLTTWNEYQSRQWSRVGPPQYDLPPNWQPPEGIEKGLNEAIHLGRRLTLTALEERLQDDQSRANLRAVLGSNHATRYESKTESKTQSKTESKTQAKIQPTAPSASSDAPRLLPEEEAPKQPGKVKRLRHAEDADKETNPDWEAARTAIEVLWTTVGLQGKPGPKNGESPPYSAIGQLINEYGLPPILELTDYCRINKVTPPQASKPWPWFVGWLRKNLHRDFTWRGKNGGGRSRPSPPEDFETGVGKL